MMFEQQSKESVSRFTSSIKVAADNFIIVADRRDFSQKIEDEMEVDFVAASDFSGHAKARTYLNGLKENLLNDPELRKAVILEHL